MARKTRAQLKTIKDSFTDGGSATANKFRDLMEHVIDSMSNGYKDVIDCSTNPNYPAADAGDIYNVTVAGKIGGASGSFVNVNDIVICITDSAAGTELAVGSNFLIVHADQPFVRKDAGETDFFNAFRGSLVVLETDVIDCLVTATDVEINIPSGFHFYPVECGAFLVGPATAVANQPTMRFGEGAGSEATIIAATAMTGMNALHKRVRFTSLLHFNGVTKLSAGVTVAGTGTANNCRAYFIGFLNQDQ